MPPTIRALPLISKARNGVGAFILQCKRMELAYCDFGGSSNGMKRFIERDLPKFAAANPQIEFVVHPRPNHHPTIRGQYINGREKVVCVRNMHESEIIQKAQLLRDSSGAKIKKTNKKVTSLNDSVRGVFSPYHGEQYKI